jgi:glutamate dehydrogenase (NAD(P)+)
MAITSDTDKSPRAANQAPPTHVAEVSNYEIVSHYFEMAADRLGLEDDVRAVLRSNYREVQVQIPVRQTDGRIHVYSGYRVQHNAARGPYKGGVQCDPTVMSSRELEAMTRRFTNAISHVIGVHRDIPAPDVNTNAQVMAWFMDTYSMHAGHTVPGVVTGKPISLGGSEGRNEATARGTVFCIVEAARHLGISLPAAKVAIQGFGNAGSIAAQLIGDEGATVVAVSDSTGGIHNPDGLDIKRVIAWKKEHGTVQGFPGSTDITNAEVLEVDCNILIPAALENQITERNAGNIKARLIAEAANGPTTPEADRILFKNSKFMIPDILCNAGGVTVSYFEWVQDLNRDHWSERVVNDKLREIMVKAFSEVLAIARREQCDMRTAAYLLAVQRVADATAMRGLYP